MQFGDTLSSNPGSRVKRSLHGVDYLVNPRQPEGVLGAMLVEVDVVDAHPPLVGILLSYQDVIGEPLRMEYFSDEACRE